MAWQSLSRSKLELIRGSDTLDVSDELQYVHEANEGFGMPPLHRISERGPLQHGVTDLGSRLDPRVIQLVLAFLSDDWDDQYARRQEILNMLTTAFDDPVKLRFTLPDGTTIRQIDCFSSSGPIYESSEILTPNMMKAAFTLIAPDPLWYNPTRNSASVQSEGGTDGFDVPVVVPMDFGEGTLDKPLALYYSGTWAEFPEIELVGQMEDAVITHVDLDMKLDFTGTLISPGDGYIIDLRYGYKTVTDYDGDSQIANLTADSDLTSFHLQPGYNNLYFEADNLDSNARFVIRYYSRFLGV